MTCPLTFPCPILSRHARQKVVASSPPATLTLPDEPADFADEPPVMVTLPALLAWLCTVPATIFILPVTSFVQERPQSGGSGQSAPIARLRLHASLLAFHGDGA